MKYEVRKPSEIPQSWRGEIIGLDIETPDEFIDSGINVVQVYNRKERLSIVIPVDVYRSGKREILSDEEKEILKNFLSTIKAVGHQLQFDLSRIKYHWGVDIDPYFDTFLLSRVLQLKSNALKDLVVQVCPEMTSVLHHLEDVVPGPPFVYNFDNPKVVAYCAYDPFLPFILMNYFKDKIKENREILKIEMDFLKVAYRIQSNGLNVNRDTFSRTLKDFESKVEVQRKEIEDLAGFKCRVNSTADLVKFLIDGMGIKPTATTDKGAISMNEKAISAMIDNESDNPVKLEALLKVRELKHNISVLSSSKKLPEWLCSDKIHPSVEQIGYDATSRVYSKDPSVNQYPKEVRESFIPDKGKKFVFFDWSGAEFYIAAYWASCELGLKWIKDGVDVHTEISKKLLHRDTVTKADRAVSKTVTFATIYGSQGYSVAQTLNVSESEGHRLVQEYLQLFPEIKTLRDNLIQETIRKGSTRTILNRRRKLPNIYSVSEKEKAKAARQAFNTAIQSSCADFFKLAAKRSLEFENVDYVFGVFDSHLLQVPEDMSDIEIQGIVDRMSDFTDIFSDFKFRGEWATGYTWKECSDKL